MDSDLLQIRRGWIPFQELGRLQDDVSRLFGVTGMGEPLLARRERGFPIVNVFTWDDESVLYAEIPGVELKDLDITIDGTTLAFSGERKVRSDIPEERYSRWERGAGPFGRSLELPHEVDRDRVEATLKDGVLRIRLPKAPQAQPRRIEVKG